MEGVLTSTQPFKNYNFKDGDSHLNNNILDGYTPLFQLIVSFTTGFVFSPFSFGLFYVLFFALIWEIVYGAKTNFKYNIKIIAFRLTLLLVSLFGWYVGRIIHGDKNPLKFTYRKRTNKYKLCKYCKNQRRYKLQDELDHLKKYHA